MAVDIYEGLELTEDSAPNDDHSAGGFKITQVSRLHICSAPQNVFICYNKT